MPPKKQSPAKPVVKSGASKTASKPAAGKKTSLSNTNKKVTPKQAKDSKIESNATVPKWSERDTAASKIQRLARGFLGRKALETKKKEREEYDLLMEKLEKEAFVKLVKMEQEKMELERQKEEEERRRKREDAKRRKRILEAAFDGEIDEIQNVLKEVSRADDDANIGADGGGSVLRARHQLAMADCEDANGNTPLSEASSGGALETVRFLVERGADPNSRGHFGRTPLYRAAFAEHLDVCQALLQYGADPRIYAEDGQTPEQVASLESVKEMLSGWDISLTETLIQKLEAAKEKRRTDEKQRRQEEMNV